MKPISATTAVTANLANLRPQQRKGKQIETATATTKFQQMLQACLNLAPR